MLIKPATPPACHPGPAGKQESGVSHHAVAVINKVVIPECFYRESSTQLSFAHKVIPYSDTESSA